MTVIKSELQCSSCCRTPASNLAESNLNRKNFCTGLRFYLKPTKRRLRVLLCGMMLVVSVMYLLAFWPECRAQGSAPAMPEYYTTSNSGSANRVSTARTAGTTRSTTTIPTRPPIGGRPPPSPQGGGLGSGGSNQLGGASSSTVRTTQSTTVRPNLGSPAGTRQNLRPIIGIVAQELPKSLRPTYEGTYSTYIAASYVKYIEGAGARVVPILVGENMTAYHDYIFSRINGILVPGGGAGLFQSSYAKATRYLYRKATKANENGDYFPMWFTCLGFELQALIVAQKQILTPCSAIDISLPLIPEPGYANSKLFRPMPQHIKDTLFKENVTSNFHKFCVTRTNFTTFNLGSELRILSTNRDKKGLEFISTVESTIYPFFGSQWHPEKNAYEWNSKQKSLAHWYSAIQMGQWFAEFFVDQARQNFHTFRNRTDEQRHLIYNYKPYYTDKEGDSTFEQTYMFR